ncbi:MAG: PilZ domain-containing protein [Pseudomonadota bacterium]
MGSDERRGGPRLDLRLRARIVDDEAFPEAEATDISPGGARLESRVPLDPDSVIHLSMDAGDGEPVEAVATVAWCRPRKGVSLRKLYDIGVSFDTEWLSQKRGKLGRALGRIFSFSEFEPARAYERVLVTLRADSVDGADQALTVVDLSEGGMQLRCEDALGAQVHTGATVVVEIPAGDTTYSIDGVIMWVAQPEGADRTLFASFGVRFNDLGDDEQRVLREIMNGEMTPNGISIFLAG